jgi:hypothetical protein
MDGFRFLRCGTATRWQARPSHFLPARRKAAVVWTGLLLPERLLYDYGPTAPACRVWLRQSDTHPFPQESSRVSSS